MTVNKNRPRSELDGRVIWLGFLNNMINMSKKIEENGWNGKKRIFWENSNVENNQMNILQW